MKYLFTTILLTALASTAMADISMGESRRRPAPKAPQATTPEAAPQAATWETVKTQKEQLLNLLRSITTPQNAEQIQGQLQQLSSAIAEQQRNLAATGNAAYPQDSTAAQLEAQLQQEINRVTGIAGGAFAQQAGLHQVIFLYLPERGYDTSGAHDVDNNTREPERPQRTAPPLRPMPRI